MAETTLIIHGYSDCSKSFEALKAYLIDQQLGDVETILYADYESREDNITFNDVIDGLNDEMIKHDIIHPDGTPKKKLNVIVHSTGGLVIRHWIWRYYANQPGRTISDCPVKRLIMLAPANFGSPLAHRGKSFLGRLAKGRWKIGDFLEVGRQILDGLELGSSFQWNLAHQDLLVTHPYFNADQIQTTVLVGIKDYDGIRGWVNKPGTDGTVVISGTSLDSAKFIIDCSQPRSDQKPYSPKQWANTNPPDDFAFGILPGLDHGSIVEPSSPGNDFQVGKLVGDALRCRTPVQFRKWIERLEGITQQTYTNSISAKFPNGVPKFQQFILHTVDDHGEGVRDFTVEFFALKPERAGLEGLVDEPVFKSGPNKGGLNEKQLTTEEKEISARIHELITSEAHPFSKDTSYRRFLVNLEEVKTILANTTEPLIITMRLFVPEVDDGIYYDNDSLQNIVIHDPRNQDQGQKTFFFENTTTLVELRVNRQTKYVTISERPKKH